MADLKITELNALTSADDADVIPIVDVSAVETKKITKSNLFAGLTTANITDSSNKRYVTDADLVDIGNLSGTNTGDQDISGKVDENAPITGATKTKITYDAKGLVTAGADATTADIADSSNKRYVTDADLTDIGNLSGTNSGDETTTTAGALINGAADKPTPVDADHVGLMDSAASNILKKLSWANIKATLKTYFDSLYAVDVAEATIATTITHTGGVAPTNPSAEKEWGYKLGSHVFVGFLRLEYDTPGSTLTSVSVVIPATWPSPFGATEWDASELYIPGAGIAATAATGTPAATSRCWIEKTGASVIRIVIQAASGSYGFYSAQVTYKY